MIKVLGRPARQNRELRIIQSVGNASNSAPARDLRLPKPPVCVVRPVKKHILWNQTPGGAFVVDRMSISI
jgi:hypothetical protein